MEKQPIEAAPKYKTKLIIYLDTKSWKHHCAEYVFVAF